MTTKHHCAVFLLACLASTGCSTLSSGHQYTLARVNSDSHLVPAGTRLAKTDLMEMPKANLGIVINGGFLRYLESIGRPEVAIFARIKIRSQNEVEETLVWEKIYLSSENPDEQIVVNKDTFLPRRDITILPGIVYDNQEIHVSLRIIELDQDDNARTKQLVNSAAGIASAFQPEAAGAISVFQAALGFLTAGNSDDIEFQYDFALHPGLPRTEDCNQKVDGSLNTDVLRPRLGTYAVIKTEHKNRFNFPDNYFDITQQSVRYLFGETLKVATLGLFNWRVWETAVDASRQDDFYQKVVGRPFQIEMESWQRPEFIGGKLSFPSVDGRLQVVNQRLAYDNAGIPETFVDQAYLMFSLIETNKGIDLTKIRAANAMKDSINLSLSTGQLSPAKLKAQLDEATSQVLAAYLGDEVRAGLDKGLSTAKDSDSVKTELAAAKAKVKDLNLDPKKAAQLNEWLRLRSERRLQALGIDSKISELELDRTLIAAMQTKPTNAYKAIVHINHAAGESLQLLTIPGVKGDYTASITDTHHLRQGTHTTVEIIKSLEKPLTPFQVKLPVMYGDKAKQLSFWVLPEIETTPSLTRDSKDVAIKPNDKLRKGDTLTLDAPSYVEGRSALLLIKSVKAGGKTLLTSINKNGQLVIHYDESSEVAISDLKFDPPVLTIKGA